MIRSDTTWDYWIYKSLLKVRCSKHFPISWMLKLSLEQSITWEMLLIGFLTLIFTLECWKIQNITQFHWNNSNKTPSFSKEESILSIQQPPFYKTTASSIMTRKTELSQLHSWAKSLLIITLSTPQWRFTTPT